LGCRMGKFLCRESKSNSEPRRPERDETCPEKDITKRLSMEGTDNDRRLLKT